MKVYRDPGLTVEALLNGCIVHHWAYADTTRNAIGVYRSAKDEDGRVIGLYVEEIYGYVEIRIQDYPTDHTTNQINTSPERSSDPPKTRDIYKPADMGAMTNRRYTEIASFIGEDAITHPRKEFGIGAVYLARELYCEVTRLRTILQSSLDALVKSFIKSEKPEKKINECEKTGVHIVPPGYDRCAVCGQLATPIEEFKE